MNYIWVKINTLIQCLADFMVLLLVPTCDQPTHQSKSQRRCQTRCLISCWNTGINKHMDIKTICCRSDNNKNPKTKFKELAATHFSYSVLPPQCRQDPLGCPACREGYARHRCLGFRVWRRVWAEETKNDRLICDWFMIEVIGESGMWKKIIQ